MTETVFGGTPYSKALLPWVFASWLWMLMFHNSVVQKLNPTTRKPVVWFLAVRFRGPPSLFSVVFIGLQLFQGKEKLRENPKVEIYIRNQVVASTTSPRTQRITCHKGMISIFANNETNKQAALKENIIKILAPVAG